MKILIVDDEKELLEKMVRFFRLEEDIEACPAENGLSAKRLLENEVFDAVVTDLDMPGLDGLALLKWIQAEGPSLPVIMMSGYGQIAHAVAAMKLGAKDYLVKPFDLEEFLLRLRHIIQNHELQDQVELGKRARPDFQDWIGESPAMLELKALVAQVAPTIATVLITGESGTGKEVVARALHGLSPRAAKPFVAINIGGIPENLVESELFGHEKGAFTGADARKIGMFELAAAGTLFLDEIGEMPMPLQVKLLRVIQELKIQRLGSTQTIPINVRILAATNKQLEEHIKKGFFREDLYYRLNIIRIKLPALRERCEDLPLLIGHFIQKFTRKMGKTVQRIEPEALRALQNYAFPGNVRELENIVERAIILTKTDAITLKDLGLAPITTKIPVKRGTLAEIQQQAILEALRRWEGNRTQAAEELGIDRKTLRNKMKAYALDASEE